MHTDGKQRRARVGELFGVNARDEPARAAGRQNPTGLSNGESTAIAVDVAELGEAGSGDRGNPALSEQIDVCLGAAAEFRRHDVRAEKRADDIERLLLVKLLEDVQSFEFVLPVEAIAALGFEGGGSMRGEVSQMGSGAQLQVLRRRAAEFRDGRVN